MFNGEERKRESFIPKGEAEIHEKSLHSLSTSACKE
jgi:hypothetical protein